MSVNNIISARDSIKTWIKNSPAHLLIVLLSWGMMNAALPASAQSGSSGVHLITPQQFKQALKGPILSAPTAFTATGEIDYDGMRKVIERALDDGCEVVTLTSGNSRYDRISYAEVKRLTRMMVETVGHRGVTIAATSANWSRDTLMDYLKYAADLGASAVQVDCPPSLKEDSSINSELHFYQMIASKTHLAIVLHGYYSEKLLYQLIDIPSIVALKEDVADLNYYVQRQIVFGQRLAVFAGGSDARYLFGYAYGSPAYFSTLYSYAPRIGQQFWKAIQSKDLKTAVSIATRYDIPFMKHWSFPFWTAAIEYLGGSQRYVRYKKGDPLNQQTLTGDEQIKMINFLRSIGLDSSGKDGALQVSEGISLPGGWERGGHVGGVVQGKIVVAGGTAWNHEKTVKSFLKNSAVFQSGHWEPGPGLPKGFAYAAYASDGSGLYVAGGMDSTLSMLKSAYRLSSITRGWVPLPDLPAGIGNGSGALLNGKFYVACGFDGQANSNKMWVLDTKNTGAGWRPCASLPGAGRIFPALVGCGKYLYLLGGMAQSSPLSPLKDAYRYDPDKDQWDHLADLPMKGYAWVGVPVGQDHLMITGRAFGKIDRGIWMLDLKDMSMKKAGDNIYPATTAPLVRAEDHQWWLIGGEPDADKNRSGKVSVITLEDVKKQ